jgi:hypothetical protein
MERGKLAAQAFEHRIHSQRKHAVVARFQLRDLRPQPTGANLDGRQGNPFLLGRADDAVSRQSATACINVAILIVAKLEKVSDTA